jgi:hypothetical protein
VLPKVASTIPFPADEPSSTSVSFDGVHVKAKVSFGSKAQFCNYLVAIAASPLAHDSANASNNNGEWMGLLGYSRALF